LYLEIAFGEISLDCAMWTIPRSLRSA